MKFRKQPKQTRIQTNVQNRRSLPVDRYYSSTSLSRVRNDQRTNSYTDHQKRSSISSGRFLNKLAHWAGAGAIILIIVLNTTLGSVGIKPTLDSEIRHGFRSDDEYRQAVQQVFQESYFNRLKLTFDSKRFEQKVVAALPEAVRATAVVPLVGTKLQVGLTISKPASRLLIDAQSQGVIGEDGRVLLTEESNAITKSFSNTPLLTIEPAVDTTAGMQLLTSEETSLIGLLRSEFDGSSADRPLFKSAIYHVQKRQIDVFFSGVNYYAKVSTERDGRTQVGSLVAAVKQLMSEKHMPANYIDVRAEGRVFVF